MRKLLTIVLAAVMLAAMTTPAAADDPPWPGYGFAGGFIFLDSFGASNATDIPVVGDVLSGDLNSNLQYRGISDRGWLGHNLDTPGEFCRGTNQSTGSMWYEVEALTAVDPPAGALSAGHSKIAKDDADVHLEMEIDAVVWDTQTQMGFRPTGRGSILSAAGVLELTYTLTNTGEHPVLDLRFYQYLHPHPNGSCWNLPDGTPGHEASDIVGRYDPKLYKVVDDNFPESERFRFDLTFWADEIVYENDPIEVFPGSTVGISTPDSPSMWGMGPVGSAPPTPVCVDHPELIWCQIEADDLPTPMATSMGPADGEESIGGALGWQLARLNTGHSVTRQVMFALSLDLPTEG